MTAGELYILPIGLGLFGRLAPAGFNATTIALWFLAAFFGNLLAGAFGTLWSHAVAAAILRSDGWPSPRYRARCCWLQSAGAAR